MRKLIMCKGLPASGTSTWSKQYQAEKPNMVRVNKDELRSMLHDGKHSKGREGFVLTVRNCVIEQALLQGNDVIVDDTNLNPIHETFLRELSARYKAEFVIQDFTDVAIETCIAQDLKRINSVGSAVIWSQYNTWMKKPFVKIEHDPSLPDCVICDIDGTLALFGKENPYHRDFTKDLVNTPVADLLMNYMEQSEAKVIFVSGRQEESRGSTEEWCAETLEISPYKLFLRPTGDTRKDAIVKQEIYEREIKGRYNVLFVLDDRDQVVQMWRDQGLTCLQVAEGNF